jgi:maltooligosyltrehalose trehalohydrolase
MTFYPKSKCADKLSLGATPTLHGVSYCVWAPKALRVEVEIRRNGVVRQVLLSPQAHGYHGGSDSEGRVGDHYRYSLEGHGTFPDPVSRAQHDGVCGWSIVVDPHTFTWTDACFRRAAFRDLVIYEIHIGTFSPDGTFRAAIERLDDLRELGIRAIEIMPIADFPGVRNWGYDGVLLYAPAACYGSPDDLRALVDAAHGRGIAVILDVVYNHLGPDGNPLPRFSDFYFSKKHQTPWGSALNFDGENNGPVREFFGANPSYWMEEFHIDGFRLDAVHAIIDESKRHILAEMTERIHERGGFVVAEDERNETLLITPVGQGGMGFDAVWADDFHHSTRVAATGEQAAYFANFGGSSGEIATTLSHGWYYSGERQKVPPQARGTNGAHLPPERFIHCISNHDQVGNRALGERINHLTPPESYRTLSALLCLSPYTPLLFMGQEWGASTPFLFFTDHAGDLGCKITEGRRKEFEAFAEYDDPAEQSRIPDPQDPATFVRSKLNWDERNQNGHRETLMLYGECLKFRAAHPALRPLGRETWQVKALDWGAVVIHLRSEGSEILIAFDLKGGRKGEIPPPHHREASWKLFLSTDEKRFGGRGRTTFDGRSLDLPTPALAILEGTVP